ncbi:MAG: hypothetical protein RL481_863 [Pseudomonadota bacterium]
MLRGQLPFFALALAAPLLLAATPPRPALAPEPLVSVMQITDVDPASTTQQTALFEALQSLIERYGVSGVNYVDKSVHGDWLITADEAKVALLSAHEQLAMLADATLEGRLAAASDDDAAEVIRQFGAQSEAGIAPSASCRLLVGSKYAAPAKKAKPKALAGSAPVSWALAIACLPGGGAMPRSMMSYNMKAAAPSTAITRGEFLHKLNEALEGSLAELAGE